MHWAVRGGIADLKHDFAQLRPHMARSFPFELDVFQKEAVLHLEKVTVLYYLPACLSVLIHLGAQSPDPARLSRQV